jgi:hypothetical protein
MSDHIPEVVVDTSASPKIEVATLTEVSMLEAPKE